MVDAGVHWLGHGVGHECVALGRKLFRGRHSACQTSIGDPFCLLKKSHFLIGLDLAFELEDLGAYIHRHPISQKSSYRLSLRVRTVQ